MDKIHEQIDPSEEGHQKHPIKKQPPACYGEDSLCKIMEDQDRPIVKCPWCDVRLDADGICPTCGSKPQGTTVWHTKQARPIVERPDWLWEMPRSMLPGTPEARHEIMAYIEHLEHNLKVTEEALSDAHTRLEGVYERHGPDAEGNKAPSLLVYNWEHVGNQLMFQCSNCKEIWTSTEGNPPPLECPRCTVKMRAY